MREKKKRDSLKEDGVYETVCETVWGRFLERKRLVFATAFFSTTGSFFVLFFFSHLSLFNSTVCRMHHDRQVASFLGFPPKPGDALQKRFGDILHLWRFTKKTRTAEGRAKCRTRGKKKEEYASQRRAIECVFL